MVDDHFQFGRNWSRFLTALDEHRIQQAQHSVELLLQRTDLRDMRFLDAGTGSGLFSLAAYRLGAIVTAFDFDPESVACGQALRARFASETDHWRVIHGSILDRDFLQGLDQFDVVYCWGVAHHTGNMWQAIENLVTVVAPGGRIVLAIYNDQQYVSRLWTLIKRVYQKLPRFLQPLYVASVGAAEFAKRLLGTLLASGLRLLTLQNPFQPFRKWIAESKSRGMHAWYDLVDWVGGWPFEVARPEEVFRFMRDRGFVLQELATSTGHGCNEFVFVRTDPDAT